MMSEVSMAKQSVKEHGHVTQELIALSNNTEALKENINRLLKTLDPILIPFEVDSDKINPPECGNLVPLAEQIRSQNIYIGVCNRLLDDIIYSISL